MRFLCFNSFKYYLVLAFSFQFINGFCQVTTDSLTTKSIERLEAAIRVKKTLLQTQQELEFIKQKALKSHDDILLARSLNDLLQIRDQLTEDTLYFRNSAFMDSLLNSSATSLQLKAIIHILHAQRISRFDTRPLKFNRAAYRTQGLKNDYAALNTFLLDSIVNNDINESLKYHSTKAEGNRLLWFSSNPDVFLFEPRFEDIALAERVNLLAIKKYFNEEQSDVLGSWLSLSSPAFLNKLDSLAGNTKNSNNILVAYQHWLSFHKTDPVTSSFIESLARKYIYLSASQDSLTRQWYIKYLQEGIASPYSAVKAHSVYQLCLIWNEEGNKYANFEDRYSYRPLPNFDPKYQFYSAKTLQLYKQHQDLMYKYPLFNKVLNLMAQQIRSRGIRIEMENQHLPGEPIPVRVIYRNTDTLFYRIIRISSTEPAGKGRVGATAQLLNRPTVTTGNFLLPLPPDNNRHAVYLKLGQLPIGHYRLLFSNMPIKTDGYDLNNLAFEVTGITAVNTDEKIFVLNRKTGFPLAGAHIKALKNKTAINSKEIPDVVNSKGYVNIAKGADSITITYKGDTTGYKFYVRNNELRNEVYNEGEFDDLTNFYDHNLRMEIFTDRSIFRPGQTVHYKIIFLTKDPNNGSVILF
ncbi:MAG: alpha-2-macroglobulin domain protein, partial [Rhodoferax sp.]|nr:alpha-2-macroglobulin domain protein [Rhodoferax sp.]